MTQTNKDPNMAILQFIVDNPDKVVLEPKAYANVLTFAFSEKLYPLDPDQFPEMRLHVIRVKSGQIAQHKTLLTHFYEMTAQRNPSGFKSVWLTTSHLSRSHLAMVELSFE